MKNDIFNWSEVAINTETESGGGRLRLRLSAPSPVYVTVMGYEVLLGVDTTFNAPFTSDFSFRVDAADGVRAFMEVLPESSFTPEPKQIYTNVDRNPAESGSVLAVRAEMRKHAIEAKAYLADIRRAREDLTKAQKAQAPRVPAEPLPDPIVEEPIA
jgi:hypothetical protein